VQSKSPLYYYTYTSAYSILIMLKSLQFLFHAIAAGNFGFGIYYDVYILELPVGAKRPDIEYAGRWKYLTFWNMVYIQENILKI
jgi:hypothetical protein